MAELAPKHNTQQSTTQEHSNNVERVVGCCKAKGNQKQTTISQMRGGNLQNLLHVLCLLAFIVLINI
jgi:hypothetical protein